jgi:hypothetical protein
MGEFNNLKTICSVMGSHRLAEAFSSGLFKTVGCDEAFASSLNRKL